MSAILTVLLFAQAASTQATPAAAPSPTACDADEYRALDFWVGDWEVYRNGSDTLVARSRIEKLYGGCAIRENWMPLRGAGGGSLSGYDPATARWHQTWFGSAPGPVFFEGGPTGGNIVLTGRWSGSGPNGEDGLTRMTYSPAGDGTVRQHGEFSADHGLTWVTTFDLLYRPRTGEE